MNVNMYKNDVTNKVIIFNKDLSYDLSSGVHFIPTFESFEDIVDIVKYDFLEELDNTLGDLSYFQYYDIFVEYDNRYQNVVVSLDSYYSNFKDLVDNLIKDNYLFKQGYNEDELLYFNYDELKNDSNYLEYYNEKTSNINKVIDKYQYILEQVGRHYQGLIVESNNREKPKLIEKGTNLEYDKVVKEYLNEFKNITNFSYSGYTEYSSIKDINLKVFNFLTDLENINKYLKTEDSSYLSDIKLITPYFVERQFNTLKSEDENLLNKILLNEFIQDVIFTDLDITFSNLDKDLLNDIKDKYLEINTKNIHNKIEEIEESFEKDKSLEFRR